MVTRCRLLRHSLFVASRAQALVAFATQSQFDQATADRGGLPARLSFVTPSYQSSRRFRRPGRHCSVGAVPDALEPAQPALAQLELAQVRGGIAVPHAGSEAPTAPGPESGLSALTRRPAAPTDAPGRKVEVRPLEPGHAGTAYALTSAAARSSRNFARKLQAPQERDQLPRGQSQLRRYE